MADQQKQLMEYSSRLDEYDKKNEEAARKFSTLLLHALGLTLLLARLLHGVALSFTGAWKFGRFYGTLLTFLVLLVTGGLCVYQGLVGLRLQ